jgi:hypothetical protein
MVMDEIGHGNFMSWSMHGNIDMKTPRDDEGVCSVREVSIKRESEELKCNIRVRFLGDEKTQNPNQKTI